MRRAGKRWARGAIPSVIVLTLLILTIRAAVAMALTSDGDHYLSLSASGQSDYSIDQGIFFSKVDPKLATDVRRDPSVPGADPVTTPEPLPSQNWSQLPTPSPTSTFSISPSGVPTPTPTPTRGSGTIKFSASPSNARRGGLVTYTIEFTASTALSNVELLSHVPDGTSSSDCSSAPGPDGHQCVFAVGDMKPGDTATRSFSVSINVDTAPGTVIKNHSHAYWTGGSVTSDDADVNVL